MTIKEKEFKSFLIDEHLHSNKVDAGVEESSPRIYYSRDLKSADLQFCGWSITLYDDGTYHFNDTSGG